MGIEGIERLSPWQNSGSDKVERESPQEEHDRKQAEQDAARRERQVRLGHIPNPDEEPPSE
jgi:hypothetical protein